MFELTGSNHRSCAQFKDVQTVEGQHFAGSGPNGLSYNYYYYYYYYWCSAADTHLRLLDYVMMPVS